jgi:hypothetical protein
MPNSAASTRTGSRAPARSPAAGRQGWSPRTDNSAPQRTAQPVRGVGHEGGSR